MESNLIQVLIRQLDAGDLSFGKIELMAWRALVDMFRRAVAEILELLDRHLMAVRDVKRHELHDRRPRTMKTLVGPVTFWRRYYWDREEKEWVFLLDKALGLTEDHISPGLLQLMLLWATKGPSYRDTRDRLKEAYGMQVLSHEGIRQAVLEVALAIERQDANRVIEQCEEGKPKRRVEALFIEADGVMVRMQGRGSRKKLREAKVVVVHEGWEQRYSGGDGEEYRLKNPFFVAGFENAEEFWERVRGQLAARYEDIDKIPVIVNGDEEAWIRQGADVFRWGLYQYDRWHLSRALRSALWGSWWQKAYRALKREDLGTVAAVVAEAEQQTTDPRRRQALSKIREAIAAHHESMRDYRQRLREMGYQVPSSWRAMGAAESNVDRFKMRLGKRGRAWSVRGAQAVMTCLGKLYENVLPQYVSRQLQRLKVWVLDQLEAGAGPLTVDCTPPPVGVRRGTFPALQHGTKGFAPLFREILRFQNP